MEQLTGSVSALLGVLCVAGAVGLLALGFAFVISRSTMERFGWWKDS